jgi:hypothetical protein
MGIGINAENKGVKYWQEKQPNSAAFGECWYDTINEKLFVFTPLKGWVRIGYDIVGDTGIFGGGTTGSIVNTIDQVTISSPSNATDFGDLTLGRRHLSSTSNGTSDTGIFGGGYTETTYFNTIDQVTISSPSNATDFGDLTVSRRSPSSTSNGTSDTGIFGGGYNGSTNVNTIDQVTISSPSNATDFGDLTLSRSGLSSTSNGLN